MAELRVGLVGAGMVAAHHLRGWAACDGARVVAIADPDLDRARARAAESDAAAFPSLAAMLAAAEIDAVDIVTPVATHVPLVREAVAAGLAVMCQKPLATTAAEARALVGALPPGARVMVHENWRWRSPYRALARLIAAGEIGRPRGFTFEVASAGLLPDATGRLPALVRQPFLARMPRLIVLELLIHHLDVLRFLFGPLTVGDVELARRSEAVRGEDLATIRLRAGDVEGVLAGDFRRPGAPPMPHDRLALEADVPVRVDGWALSVAGRTVADGDATAAYQASYTDAIRHFADAVRRGTPFETPAALAVQTLETVEAIYAAARGFRG